jgi:hypothetical protein
VMVHLSAYAMEKVIEREYPFQKVPRFPSLNSTLIQKYYPLLHNSTKVKGNAGH